MSCISASLNMDIQGSCDLWQILKCKGNCKVTRTLSGVPMSTPWVTFCNKTLVPCTSLRRCCRALTALCLHPASGCKLTWQEMVWYGSSVDCAVTWGTPEPVGEHLLGPDKHCAHWPHHSAFSSTDPWSPSGLGHHGWALRWSWRSHTWASITRCRPWWPPRITCTWKATPNQIAKIWDVWTLNCIHDLQTLAEGPRWITSDCRTRRTLSTCVTSSPSSRCRSWRAIWAACLLWHLVTRPDQSPAHSMVPQDNTISAGKVWTCSQRIQASSWLPLAPS